MQMIIGGAIAGVILAVASIFLILKLPPQLYVYCIRHYLITDIVFTWIAVGVLPVVGIATLISSGVYMLLFTIFLSMEHKKLAL